MSELLDLKEVAVETKASIHTVRSWIYQRKIPFTRVGRRLLVPRQGLERILKRNSVPEK